VAERRTRVDFDDLAGTAPAGEGENAIPVRFPQPRKERVSEERHLEGRLELVLQRRLTASRDLGALGPEPCAVGAGAPRIERSEVQRIAGRRWPGPPGHLLVDVNPHLRRMAHAV
jgi:hypothetical protein